MKKLKHNKIKQVINTFLVLLVVFLGANSSFGQLSGKYTINQNAKTEGTNYATFTEFSDALTKLGIKGSVIADVVVKSGPYDEAVSFYNVAGSDAKNTITINGNGETIQDGKRFFVIELNGASNFIFNNLNVEMNKGKASSYEKCYWIHDFVSKEGNILSSNITIKNSNLTMPNVASSNQFSAYIGITTSESGFNKVQQAAGQDIIILNNKMSSGTNMGPYQGVLIVGANGSKGYQRVTIESNEIRDLNTAGIVSYYNTELMAVGNEIHNTKSTGHQAGASKEKRGIFLNIGQSEIGESTISKNSIHDIDNTKDGGYVYGIHVSGGEAMGGVINVNDNNIVQKTGYGTATGIWFEFYKRNAFKIVNANNNFIEMSCLDERSDHTTTGIFLHGEGNSNTAQITCSKNQIFIDAPAIVYGIHILGYEMKALENENQITNNVVNVKSDLFTSGISLILKGTDGEFLVANNTLNLGGCTFSTFNGMKVSFGFELVVVNGRHENNLINIKGKKGGDVYGIYDESSSLSYVNNCLYLEPSKVARNYYGYQGRNGNLPSFTDWVKGSGSKNDINEPAMYVDEAKQIMIPGNPKLVNVGMPIKEVSDDVFGTKRDPKTPDIGAIEFYYDIEVLALKVKSGDVCEGFEDKITVTLKNNNPMSLPFLSVNIYSNNVLIASGTSKGAVAAGAKTDIVIDVKYKGAGKLAIKAKIADDENMKNNEKIEYVSIKPSPAGSEFFANVNSKAQHLPKSTFDLTTVEDGLIFDVTNPRIFTNSEYESGKGWTAKISTTYANGKPVSSKDAAVWDKKADKNNGTITFMPTSALVDSTITISLTVLDELSGCDTTISRDVKVVPSGKAGFIVPLVLCENEAVVFDNTSTVHSGSLSYAWDFKDNGATSVSTHPIHKFSGAGTYNVKLTTTTIPWGIVREYSMPVVVGKLPVADFTKVNACEGSDIELTNTSTGGTSYTWSFGDVSIKDVYTKDAKVNYAPGKYTVTLQVEEKGCINSVSKGVMQYAMPKAAFVNTSGACTSDKFEFENKTTIDNGNVGYTWDFDDNGGFSTMANPSYKFTNIGIHKVVLNAVSEFGCENSTSKSVTVKAGPVADFTYDLACSVTETNFTNASVIPNGINADFTWDFGDGSAVSNSVNPSHKWDVVGTYTTKLSVVLENGCTSEYSEKVKVLNEPIADFKVNDVCVGEEVIFVNNSSWNAGNVDYLWDFDGLINGSKNSMSPKGTAKVAGTYNVTLKVKVGEGCENTVSKTVEISEVPVSCKIVSTPDHINGVNGYKFEASKDGVTASTESDVSYYWVISEHGNKNGASINVDFQEQGNFTVQLTAKNDKTGCECTSSINHNNVGIQDELTAENNVVVYPNPATSELTILMEQLTAKDAVLMNSVGSIVKTVDSKSIVGGKVTLDISDLASGLYLVRITSGNTISTKKVTINN